MKPTVYLLCGLPLSGKTSYSKNLEKQTGAVRLSLDEEYFNLVGNRQQEYRNLKLEEDIEEKLKTKVAELLANNKSVVLDYGFWKKEKRDKYKMLIENNGGQWKLIYLKTPKKELLHRLKERNSLKQNDNQFITPIMLEAFYKQFEEPLSEGEEIILS